MDDQARGCCTSVLVVVLTVSSVPTSIVDVVNVIAVGDCNMATTVAVNVVMMFMNGVTGRLTFVVMAAVLPMNMTIVKVVDMAVVRYRYVAASVSMYVVMAEVFLVKGVRHGSHRPSLSMPC